jgi:Type II CAAX prenyl endopeptidase Rce1-like
MTATPPAAAAGGQPIVGSQPSVPAPAGGLGGAVLVVGTRVGLWLGVQLGLAGLLILVGAAAAGQALDEAAGWWMVYGALVDLGTLGVIGWLLKRDHGSYRDLLGPPTTVWQVALGAAGVLAASVGAVAFSAQLSSARYGEAIAPMFAVVDLPPWASVLSVLVVSLLAELAEPVAYLGVVLPRLEQRLGRSWLAATIVVALWAGEHALYPLLTSSGGGLDWGFAAYRVGSVLPFLAAWTALFYALGRRLLPVMAARGCSTPAPPWPWPWAWSHEPALPPTRPTSGWWRCSASGPACGGWSSQLRAGQRRRWGG